MFIVLKDLKPVNRKIEHPCCFARGDLLATSADDKSNIAKNKVELLIYFFLRNGT